MKLIQYILLVGCVSLVVSCETRTKKHYSAVEIAQESAKLNTFFEKQFNGFLDRHPIYQTYLGIKKDADKWNDISDAFKIKELELTKKALSWLQDSVHTDALNADATLSYQLFKQQLENDIADDQYKKYEYPVNQMEGMQAAIPAFFN